MFIHEIWGKFTFHFLKFQNLPYLTREISKFQLSELSKFIPNFSLKHVITSTNTSQDKNVNTSRTKRDFNSNKKTFFIIFRELPVVRNCLRLDSGPLI